MATEHPIAKPVLVEAPGAIASPKLDGAGLHVAMVYTRQCHEIVDALVTSCRAELLLKGVTRSNIHELQVSLPFEIPYAMKRMMEAAPVKFDAVVVIGCMVKGATMSFEFVAEAVTRASMKIGMKLKTPVIYGVLACLDEQQARECAGLTAEGKTRTCSYGVEWAQSAIEMALINNCACGCHGKSGKERKEEQAQQQCEASSCESKEEGDDELAEATGEIELSPFKRSVEHSLQKGDAAVGHVDGIPSNCCIHAYEPIAFMLKPLASLFNCVKKLSRSRLRVGLLIPENPTGSSSKQPTASNQQQATNSKQPTASSIEMASPATRSHSSSSSQSSSDTAGAHAEPVLVEKPGASLSASRQLDGKGMTIAIVFSRWYGKEVVGPLVEACTNELVEKGVSSSNVIRVEVSGAFEIPFAASRLIQTKHDKLDAVICIGCMVKGATMTYEFVSEAVTMAIMKLNVMTDTPVIFGVLTCSSVDQAKQCAADVGECGSSGEKCNHGIEWAQSALEMAHLKRCTTEKIAKKCKCKCHCESKKCNCSCHCTDCKCKTCTCTDCECVSCAGEKKATKSGSGGGGGGACSGCGKGSEDCGCQGCNCSVCSQKTSKAKSLA